MAEETRQPQGAPVAAPGGQPDPEESPWRTNAARVVYRNAWLTVTEYAVTRPDGAPGIYGVVDPGDNVTIVPLTQDGQVWLLGAFLFPMQTFAWGLPGGSVEHGEDPLVAAQRELAEEMGLRAARWDLLGTSYLSPGISSQRSYLYLARDLTEGTPQPEGTERHEPRVVPLAEAVRACRAGEILTAPCVLALEATWRLLGDDR